MTRLFLILLLAPAMTLAMVTPHAAAVLAGPRSAVWIPMLWHRVVRRLLRVSIRVVGEPLRGEPVLYVANHVSWLDIVTMGAILPASFVAKSEVGRWPGIRYLAKLQRTVFVSRGRRTANKERHAMTQRLEKGDSLILFPEGTSHDGLRIGEFHSAFLSLADIKPNGKPLKVQPFSITYTEVDGFPVTRRTMDRVAWYGDMELAPHLLAYLKGGPYECTLQFFEPVTLAELGNRKRLARYCRALIVEGNSQALSGALRRLPEA